MATKPISDIKKAKTNNKKFISFKAAQFITKPFTQIHLSKRKSTKKAQTKEPTKKIPFLFFILIKPSARKQKRNERKIKQTYKKHPKKELYNFHNYATFNKYCCKLLGISVTSIGDNTFIGCTIAVRSSAMIGGLEISMPRFKSSARWR